MAATSAQNVLEKAIDHATPRVPVAVPGDSVREVRAAISGQAFDCAEDVAVVDHETLVGLVSIEKLLSADGKVLIGDLMDPDPPVVAPEADQEVAARTMCERGESSLAVVDAEGRFVGLVPDHRMLTVLLDEHDEDLARLGGYMTGTRRARHAAEESVRRRLWHRLPWLIAGLAGAMASAVIVGAFEEHLQQTVLLAFFLPAVVYMADAVGTQTETVLIRGLSAGIDMRKVVRREMLAGLLLGILVGAAFFPFALIGWGEADVALAVGLALFASCSIATLVAMLLPWWLQRLGLDPAFGSGPLATIIQDLLSIAGYLAIAVPIAT